MPFGDSIRILSLSFVFFGSAAVISYAIFRLIRYQKISRRLMLIASLALVPFAATIVSGMKEGDIELNPVIESKEQLVGTYSNGNQSLSLNADETFVAKGLPLITSGTWSHYDWNLTLSNTRLRQPRIVTRNGVLCIAPSYAGVDEPIGILLKKETQPAMGADLRIAPQPPVNATH